MAQGEGEGQQTEQAFRDLANVLSKSAGGGNIFAKGGQFDPVGLFGGIFHTVEFRSNLTPSVQVKTADFSFDAPSSPWTRLLQPTVIFYGVNGEAVVAPGGESRPNVGLVASLALIAALVGVGFMLGRATKKG